jgi:hypothetical protein
VRRVADAAREELANLLNEARTSLARKAPDGGAEALGVIETSNGERLSEGYAHSEEV